MYEEVSSHAAAVGFPFAPLEEVLRVEGNFRRSSKKGRPVAGYGRSIQRNGIVPSAHRRIAIPMRGDHVELADGSGSEQFFRLRINDRAHALASDLENPVRGAGGFDHLRPISVEMNHRLFAIDILA